MEKIDKGSNKLFTKSLKQFYQYSFVDFKLIIIVS